MRVCTQLRARPPQVDAPLPLCPSLLLVPLLLHRPAVAELPFLLHTRSSDEVAKPEHAAAAAGQAGLDSLMEMLAGDEVRCSSTEIVFPLCCLLNVDNVKWAVLRALSQHRVHHARLATLEPVSVRWCDGQVTIS
jgi:hypothetical protein